MTVNPYKCIAEEIFRIYKNEAFALIKRYVIFNSKYYAILVVIYENKYFYYENDLTKNEIEALSEKTIYQHITSHYKKKDSSDKNIGKFTIITNNLNVTSDGFTDDSMDEYDPDFVYDPDEQFDG